MRTYEPYHRAKSQIHSCTVLIQTTLCVAYRHTIRITMCERCATKRDEIEKKFDEYCTALTLHSTHKCSDIFLVSIFHFVIY